MIREDYPETARKMALEARIKQQRAKRCYNVVPSLRQYYR